MTTARSDATHGLARPVPRTMRVSSRALLTCLLVALTNSAAAAAPTCVDVRQTGQMLLGDLRGTVAYEWRPLVLGLGAAALTHPVDDDVNQWVERQDPSALTAPGRVAGSWQVQVPLAGALVVVSAVKGCARPFSWDLVRALGVNTAFTNAIKFSVRRERPNHESLRVSFPSGHVSSTFALATVAQQHAGWVVGAASYGLATYTAWTRVRDNKHWVSDTVFGAALGVAVGRAVVRTGRRSTWTVVPTASRGQLGLLVVH